MARIVIYKAPLGPAKNQDEGEVIFSKTFTKDRFERFRDRNGISRLIRFLRRKVESRFKIFYQVHDFQRADDEGLAEDVLGGPEVKLNKLELMIESEEKKAGAFKDQDEWLQKAYATREYLEQKIEDRKTKDK